MEDCSKIHYSQCDSIKNAGADTGIYFRLPCINMLAGVWGGGHGPYFSELHINNLADIFLY